MTTSDGDTEFGASVDSVTDEATFGQVSLPDDLDDEFDEALPNGESLIAAAVALAATGPDGLAEAQLVQRYWRFAPDEELVDLTPEYVRLNSDYTT